MRLTWRTCGSAEALVWCVRVTSGANQHGQVLDEQVSDGSCRDHSLPGRNGWWWERQRQTSCRWTSLKESNAENTCLVLTGPKREEARWEQSSVQQSHSEFNVLIQNPIILNHIRNTGKPVRKAEAQHRYESGGEDQNQGWARVKTQETCYQFESPYKVGLLQYLWLRSEWNMLLHWFCHSPWGDPVTEPPNPP